MDCLFNELIYLELTTKVQSKNFIMGPLWQESTGDWWIPHTKGQQYRSGVHVANMWPIWGRQDPGGPYVGPMNFVIWVCHYVIMHAQFFTFISEL